MAVRWQIDGLHPSLYAPPSPQCAALTRAFHSSPWDRISNVPRIVLIIRSEQLFATLRNLAASPKTSKLISEVRGQGLMVAMEFRSPSDELSVLDLPESERASVPKDIGKRVQKICLDQGLLILTTSCFDTIRFIPALTISEEEMAQGLEVFKAAVEQVAREG